MPWLGLAGAVELTGAELDSSLDEQLSAQPLQLWYDAPASRWTEALPIGNGRLGAMVFGGVDAERLQLNEDTLWTGGPHDYDHPGAAEALPRLRELLFAGKQQEAEALAAERFMSIPIRQRAYQPLGDLQLEFSGHDAFSEYRRTLDPDTAIATTSYLANGLRFTRDAFASHPDRAIVLRLTCDRPGRLEFRASLTSPQSDVEVTPFSASTTGGDSAMAGLQLVGRVSDRLDQTGLPVPGEMRFAARLVLVDTDGTAQADDSTLQVSGAAHATLLVAAATNYVNSPRRPLATSAAGEPLRQAPRRSAASAMRPPAQGPPSAPRRR